MSSLLLFYGMKSTAIVRTEGGMVWIQPLIKCCCITFLLLETCPKANTTATQKQFKFLFNDFLYECCFKYGYISYKIKLETLEFPYCCQRWQSYAFVIYEVTANTGFNLANTAFNSANTGFNLSQKKLSTEQIWPMSCSMTTQSIMQSCMYLVIQQGRPAADCTLRQIKSKQLQQIKFL